MTEASEPAAERQEVSDHGNPIGKYKISLDGEWIFEDFSDLPYLYVQVYGFFAELESIRAQVSPIDATVLVDPLAPQRARRFNYPWAGGWSSANFYRALVRELRPDTVPKVLEIQFASPGYIELMVLLGVAAAVRRSINQTAKTAQNVNKAYDEIYRSMQERELLALDVRQRRLDLSRQEIAFLEESRKRLGDAIGLTSEDAKAAIKLSPGIAGKPAAENELGAVKVLMSLVRRIQGLAKFEQDGKAKF